MPDRATVSTHGSPSIQARWAPAEGRLAIPHIGTRVYLG